MAVTLEELSDLDYGKEHRFARRTFGPTAEELHRELKKLALKSKNENVRLAAIQYVCAVDGQAPKAEAKIEHSGTVEIHTHYISPDPVKKPGQTDVAVQTRGLCQEDEA